jgi:hypothetical protein
MFDPREVPGCSANLPEMYLEVTSYHSHCNEFWVDNRLRYVCVHRYLRLTLLVSDNPTGTGN